MKKKQKKNKKEIKQKIQLNKNYPLHKNFQPNEDKNKYCFDEKEIEKNQTQNKKNKFQEMKQNNFKEKIFHNQNEMHLFHLHKTFSDFSEQMNRYFYFIFNKNSDFLDKQLLYNKYFHTSRGELEKWKIKKTSSPHLLPHLSFSSNFSRSFLDLQREPEPTKSLCFNHLSVKQTLKEILRRQEDEHKKKIKEGEREEEENLDKKFMLSTKKNSLSGFLINQKNSTQDEITSSGGQNHVSRSLPQSSFQSLGQEKLIHKSETIISKSFPSTLIPNNLTLYRKISSKSLDRKTSFKEKKTNKKKTEEEEENQSKKPSHKTKFHVEFKEDNDEKMKKNVLKSSLPPSSFSSHSLHFTPQPSSFCHFSPFPSISLPSNSLLSSSLPSSILLPKQKLNILRSLDTSGSNQHKISEKQENRRKQLVRIMAEKGFQRPLRSIHNQLSSGVDSTRDEIFSTCSTSFPIFSFFPSKSNPSQSSFKPPLSSKFSSISVSSPQTSARTSLKDRLLSSPKYIRMKLGSGSNERNLQGTQGASLVCPRPHSLPRDCGLGSLLERNLFRKPRKLFRKSK